MKSQKIEEFQKVPDQPEQESDSKNDTFADKTVGNLDAAVVANEQFVPKRVIKATNKLQKIFQEENKDGDDQSDEQIKKRELDEANFKCDFEKTTNY
jgi:hypothetical protein